jgi:transposase
MGRGYSFEVVRARLLYEDKALDKTKKKLRQKIRRETTGMARTTTTTTIQSPPKFYKTVVEERVVEYGPHIPTLCDLLESGHFD